MSHLLTRRRPPLQIFLYRALCYLADLIEDVFGLYKNERPQTMPSHVTEWSTELCLEKCKKAIHLEDDEPSFAHSLYRIDDATVAKLVLCDGENPSEQQHEVLHMDFVLEHTTIPIPQAHRIVTFRDGYAGYIVMDYIRGRRLDRAWPQLSLWSKLRVAWILRSYIRQLRRISCSRSVVPGPLGEGPKLFPEGTIDSLRPSGPFATAAALNTYINKRSSINGGIDVPQEYEIPEPLVFTHADLNMRNIILDDSGRVWLIDWDFSGFYPKSWEFILMTDQAETHDIKTPLSWRRCVPFITDSDFGRYRWVAGRLP